MKRLLSTLFDIRHRDEEARQRGRNVVIIAFGLLVINVLVSLSIVFYFRDAVALLIATASGALLYVLIIAITRLGQVDLGGWLVVLVSLVGTITASFVNPDRPVAMFMVVPVVLAATILRFRDLTVVTLVVLLSLIGIAIFAEPAMISLSLPGFLATSGILCGFLAVISFVQSAGNEALHRRLQAALQQARQTAAQLQQINAELDLRVEAQTAALQEAMAELEERALAQDRLLAEVISQRDVIRNLSVPVLPVGKQALVMPLVGAIDRDRLALIQQQALTQIEQQRARWLILDVTGVPVIDTDVAAGLVQLVQSVRLLGAEVALVGVRPEVAQTMVSLGIELPVSRVYSDLAGAIERVR
ncbi:STAS domain-containing protein [Chloroflexus sp.]|uniref:STAS domain-containing protein n=1 Tax=Chloroflexus sp. TaxID=1904827 RepID=UPI00298EFA04|nr:STAS domain-containing protein [Chloroflexus sp.]MDW8403309.1 STAS domain-containing protein [Chloroflexus sp.]